ncbi:hypothetical protein CEXT_60191 [Caerostris extrusa]|uniref:Uncharacterized protein n=1 Tax=Caerostris extrusa TaxID=172846 RepID=A0AAV4P2F5_CAEEX|nr:hypothetical protein CEXT_60191 [Caerostris extrusa]
MGVTQTYSQRWFRVGLSLQYLLRYWAEQTMSWTQFFQVMNRGARTTNRKQMTKTKPETSQLHTNTGGALGWLPASSGIKK